VTTALVTILTVVTQISTVLNALPPLTYTTWIHEFLLTCLMFNAIAFLQYGIVNYFLHNRQASAVANPAQAKAVARENAAAAAKKTDDVVPQRQLSPEEEARVNMPPVSLDQLANIASYAVGDNDTNNAFALRVAGGNTGYSEGGIHGTNPQTPAPPPAAGAERMQSGENQSNLGLKSRAPKGSAKGSAVSATAAETPHSAAPELSIFHLHPILGVPDVTIAHRLDVFMRVAFPVAFISYSIWKFGSVRWGEGHMFDTHGVAAWLMARNAIHRGANGHRTAGAYGATNPRGFGAPEMRYRPSWLGWDSSGSMLMERSQDYKSHPHGQSWKV
jgi:hypothetical protein